MDGFKDCLHKLNPYSSVGLGRDLSHLADILVRTLSNFFECLWRLDYQQFEKGKVLNLHAQFQKDKKYDARNDQPVSSIPERVMKCILLGNVSRHMREKQVDKEGTGDVRRAFNNL